MDLLNYFSTAIYGNVNLVLRRWYKLCRELQAAAGNGYETMMIMLLRAGID